MQKERERERQHSIFFIASGNSNDRFTQPPNADLAFLAEFQETPMELL